jgi:hypothetical protein
MKNRLFRNEEQLLTMKDKMGLSFALTPLDQPFGVTWLKEVTHKMRVRHHIGCAPPPTSQDCTDRATQVDEWITGELRKS